MVAGSLGWEIPGQGGFGLKIREAAQRVSRPSTFLCFCFFSLWAGETRGLQKAQGRTVRDREVLL